MNPELTDFMTYHLFYIQMLASQNYLFYVNLR